VTYCEIACEKGWTRGTNRCSGITYHPDEKANVIVDYLQNQFTSYGLCDENVFSSETMLHKDYYRKSSAGKKISVHGSEGAWRQDELIGGKLPVAK
jgi:hypothetical protein